MKRTDTLALLIPFCIVWLLCLPLAEVRAQNGQNTGGELEEDVIERAAEESDNIDISLETYEENLQFLRNNPIVLNKASADVLRSTYLFTELQIRDLLRHIELFGPLHNIYELQTIPSFSMEDIYAIKPYIVVSGGTDNTLPFGQQLYSGNYQLFMRASRYLELQDGYIADSLGNTKYAGDNYRLYTRFRYNYQNSLSYGFTAEKDPGEQFFGQTQPNGFDYYSFHFFKRSKGVVRTLALGDYSVRIGQGLTMWTGYGYGKSVFPMSIRRSGPVLAAYTSTSENLFLRGGGATFAYKGLQCTFFGSYKSVDANATTADTLTDAIEEISAIDESGLHRTETELSKKDIANETIGGVDITYFSGQANIGVSAVHLSYSVPLIKNIDPYEVFVFNGKSLDNFGLHYTALWRNLLFFGETAMSGNGSAATLNGLIMPVDPRIDLAILYRDFSKGYQTIYASTFSESSDPQAERGIYVGTEIKPGRGWKISAYVDMYAHTWLAYRTDAPGYGHDILAELNWQPSRGFQTYFRLRREISDRNASSSDFEETPPMAVITSEEKTSIRWNANYTVNKSLTLRSRIEYRLYHLQSGEPERGYLLYQDINYKPLGKNYSFATRFALFNTDSYDARIYTYESEVLYAYSIVALSGRGSRAYVLAEWSPTRWMDIWGRIGRTIYIADYTIGSGNDAFPGNTRTDLRFQVRFKW